MEKLSKKYLLVLIIIALLSGPALAGDTYSFKVSCTIPAIPGVNAPLLEEEKLNTASAKETEKELTVIKNEAQQREKPAELKQDAQEKQITQDVQKPLVMVRTVYER